LRARYTGEKIIAGKYFHFLEQNFLILKKRCEKVAGMPFVYFGIQIAIK